MKLLLENKEIANFLCDQIDHYNACSKIEFTDEHMKSVIFWIELEKSKYTFNLDEKRDVIKKKIRKAVTKDLNTYVDKVKRHLDKIKNEYYNLINHRTQYFIDRLGEEKVLKKYLENKRSTGFIKGTGTSLSNEIELIRRKDYTDISEDCLFRNMQGNEELILSKINNNLPFWFIDTGYTNFINGKKKTWHRLTRNHLHHIKYFEAPVDRLNVFEKFPQPWRENGHKILVIEPGSFSAKTFNVDIKSWKLWVETELRKYTDRPIVFREKLTKKVRKNLYQELCDEDYYCVININSNAAIESIWAGIPAITLADHISNFVSRRNLSDINNLYKPHLANWLCMLSYSQFTYEELINGTAARIVKKYHV